jgi:hypothetical protein
MLATASSTTLVELDAKPFLAAFVESSNLIDLA